MSRAYALQQSRLSNSHDVSTPDRTHRGNRCGRQQRQIAKTVGWSTENHQGNLPPAQVLLIRNVLVHGNQNIKAGFFGSLQEAPVFQARKIGETGGFALVAREQKPQSLVNAFVDQNPHDARASKSFLASASASKA